MHHHRLRRMTIPDLAAAITLFLLFAASAALGSASTIAISHGSGIVCGILAGTSPTSIQCARGSQAFPVLPNASFASLSAGRDFFCGLRSGGNSFFCWNAINSSSGTGIRPKRLYIGSVPLQDLSVGEDHICAAQNGTGIRWWRGNGRFPITAAGEFRSLTSGNGFSCGIRTNDSRVWCWGNRDGIGKEIQIGFANVSMSTIVAGDSHACGIDTAGSLHCKGRNDKGQLDLPSDSSPFEFSNLAMGQTHSCAIRRENLTVVCWGGGRSSGGGDGSYYRPVKDTSFELISAAGNLTCGVATLNFSVICWESDRFRPSVTVLPLHRILPGICTDNGSCSCGEFPASENLCSGSGVICESCDLRVTQQSQPLSPSPSPPPSPPTTSRRTSKGLLAFAILGSVGAFAGISTIIYRLWTGICRQKKVHNSVQPTIAGVRNDGANNAHTTVSTGSVVTHFNSPSKSRSRSRSLVFGRQGSRLMRRQRSGPSSYTDRAEEFRFSELAAATKNFSLETKIGAGSFGTVYKGKLADGREVAIKRSETGTRTKKFQEKESAFQSELSLLSRLHHKHLVSLVGFCEEREERLLVYEYMKNGALYDHLHSKDGDTGVLNSWKMRIKILLDAARGIEYLHNYAVPPIIHRDIKSSNILLDGYWTARVSDFGLSLNGPESDGGHMSVNAAGTVGYMDPEYYGLQHLTVKSDVYGFGVVMLEVVTGKRAIFNDANGNLISVVDYTVPRILAGEVGRVLDARVWAPGSNEAEAVEMVAHTAFHCVSLESSERPTMRDIVANLDNALSLCDNSHGSNFRVSISLSSYD